MEALKNLFATLNKDNRFKEHHFVKIGFALVNQPNITFAKAFDDIKDKTGYFHFLRQKDPLFEVWRKLTHQPELVFEKFATQPDSEKCGELCNWLFQQSVPEEALLQILRKLCEENLRRDYPEIQEILSQNKPLKEIIRDIPERYNVENNKSHEAYLKGTQDAGESISFYIFCRIADILRKCVESDEKIAKCVFAVEV